MVVPSLLNQSYFCTPLAWWVFLSKRKDCKFSNLYTTGSPIVLCFRLTCKNLRLLLERKAFIVCTKLFCAICSTMNLKRAIRTIKPLRRIFVLEVEHVPSNLESPLAQSADVDIEAFKVVVTSDNTLCYTSSLLFTSLNFVIPNCEPYTEGAERDSLEKCAMHGKDLLPFFCSLRGPLQQW